VKRIKGTVASVKCSFQANPIAFDITKIAVSPDETPLTNIKYCKIPSPSPATLLSTISHATIHRYNQVTTPRSPQLIPPLLRLDKKDHQT